MKYRMIKAEEVIHECDEFNGGTKRTPKWVPTVSAGCYVGLRVGYYRRPIFEPIPVSNFRFYRGRRVKHD